MRTAAVFGAAVLYHLFLLAAYLVTGPLRQRYLDPVLGAVPASMLEAAIFIAVSLVCAALVLSRFTPAWTPRSAAAVGLGALLLFAISDAVVATMLCGVSLARHFARFVAMAGLIQAGALAFHAAVPALWLPGDGRDPAQQTPSGGSCSHRPGARYSRRRCSM